MIVEYTREMPTDPADGDVFTREEWDGYVRSGCFNDDDGGAKPAKDGKMSPEYISISSWPAGWPADATHIVFFGK